MSLQIDWGDVGGGDAGGGDAPIDYGITCTDTADIDFGADEVRT